MADESSNEGPERIPQGPPHVYDQIIIGGGPAGLTAAVYSARKGLDTLLVTEDIGGQVLWTMEIENYMGFQIISGLDLIQKFEEQSQQFPVDRLIADGAQRLEKIDDRFAVTTKSGKRFEARSLILSPGKRSRPLNVPGETELRGRGVTYCSTCDGPFFKNLDVAVVGGGNSGVTAVVDLLPIAKKIYSINVADALQADKILVDRARAASNVEFLLGYDVTDILGENVVKSIRLRRRADGAVIEKPVDGVFIEIGLLPNTDFCEGFVELTPEKEIKVDCACNTSVPGVFAAGDATTAPEKQIIVAAGEGAKASLSAYHYLIRQE